MDGEEDRSDWTHGAEAYWARHGGWPHVAAAIVARHRGTWLGAGMSEQLLLGLVEQLGLAVLIDGPAEPVKMLEQELHWALAACQRSAGLHRMPRPADVPARGIWVRREWGAQ